MAVRHILLGVIVFALLMNFIDCEESVADEEDSADNADTAQYLLDLVLSKRSDVDGDDKMTYYRDDAKDLDKRFLCGNFNGKCGAFRHCCHGLFCDRSPTRAWMCKTCISSGTRKTGSKCYPRVSGHCCAGGTCKKVGFLKYRCLLPNH